MVYKLCFMRESQRYRYMNMISDLQWSKEVSGTLVDVLWKVVESVNKIEVKPVKMLIFCGHERMLTWYENESNEILVRNYRKMAKIHQWLWNKFANLKTTKFTNGLWNMFLNIVISQNTVSATNLPMATFHAKCNDYDEYVPCDFIVKTLCE